MLHTRFFHSSCLRSGRVKESLNFLTRLDVIKPPLSRTELKYREEKRKEYELRKAQRPLTKSTARKVIEKKLNTTFGENKIGPNTKFTEDQLQILFKNPNKRLIYTFLGTSAAQLKDADIVNRDVAKFLSRDEVSKAIYLSKLAQKKGVVAMNKVMEYLLSHQLSNEAIALYNYRKKWGVVPNDFTHSILFDGLSRQPQPLNKKMVAQILKIVENLRQKGEFSTIHANTALKALFHSNDPESAITLFENLERKEINLDNKIFTVYLKCLGQLQDMSENLKITKADECFTKAMDILSQRKIDSHLVLQYALCYSQATNLKYVSRSVNIMRSWFQICPEEQIKQIVRYTEPHDYRFTKKEPVLETLKPLDELNESGKRFPVTTIVLDAYMATLSKLGLHKKAADVFMTLKDKVTTDVKLYNRYLSCLTKQAKRADANVADEELLEALKAMTSSKLQPDDRTMNIVYKYFDKRFQENKSHEVEFNATMLRFYESTSQQIAPQQRLGMVLDYIKLVSKLASGLEFKTLMKTIDTIYFSNLAETQVYSSNMKYIDSTKAAKLRNMEITILSMLKSASISAAEENVLTEQYHHEINRLRNALQAHVRYLSNYKTEDDPGFDSLAKIEEEKMKSVESFASIVC